MTSNPTTPLVLSFPQLTRWGEEDGVASPAAAAAAAADTAPWLERRPLQITAAADAFYVARCSSSADDEADADDDAAAAAPLEGCRGDVRLELRRDGVLLASLSLFGLAGSDPNEGVEACFDASDPSAADFMDACADGGSLAVVHAYEAAGGDGEGRTELRVMGLSVSVVPDTEPPVLSPPPAAGAAAAAAEVAEGETPVEEEGSAREGDETTLQSCHSSPPPPSSSASSPSAAPMTCESEFPSVEGRDGLAQTLSSSHQDEPHAPQQPEAPQRGAAVADGSAEADESQDAKAEAEAAKATPLSGASSLDNGATQMLSADPLGEELHVGGEAAAAAEEEGVDSEDEEDGHRAAAEYVLETGMRTAEEMPLELLRSGEEEGVPVAPLDEGPAAPDASTAGEEVMQPAEPAAEPTHDAGEDSTEVAEEGAQSAEQTKAAEVPCAEEPSAVVQGGAEAEAEDTGKLREGSLPPSGEKEEVPPPAGRLAEDAAAAAPADATKVEQPAEQTSDASPTDVAQDEAAEEEVHTGACEVQQQPLPPIEEESVPAAPLREDAAAPVESAAAEEAAQPAGEDSCDGAPPDAPPTDAVQDEAATHTGACEVPPPPPPLPADEDATTTTTPPGHPAAPAPPPTHQKSVEELEGEVARLQTSLEASVPVEVWRATMARAQEAQERWAHLEESGGLLGGLVLDLSDSQRQQHQRLSDLIDAVADGSLLEQHRPLLSPQRSPSAGSAGSTGDARAAAAAATAADAVALEELAQQAEACEEALSMAREARACDSLELSMSAEQEKAAAHAAQTEAASLRVLLRRAEEASVDGDQTRAELVAAAKRRLEKADDRAAELEARLLEGEKRLLLAESEAASLRADLVALVNERVFRGVEEEGAVAAAAVAESEQSRLEEEVRVLEEENEDLQAQCDAGVERLSALGEQLMQVSEGRMGLASSVKELKDEARSLRSESDGLRSSLEEANARLAAAAAEAAQLGGRVQEAEAEAASAGAAGAAARGAAEEAEARVQGLVGEVAAGAETAEGLRRQVAAAEAKAEAESKNMKMVEEVKEVLEATKEQLAQSHAECAALKLQLQNETDEFQRKVAALEEDQNQRDAQIEAQQREMSKLRARLPDPSEVESGLRSELATCRKEMTRMSRTHRDLLAELDLCRKAKKNADRRMEESMSRAARPTPPSIGGADGTLQRLMQRRPSEAPSRIKELDAKKVTTLANHLGHISSKGHMNSDEIDEAIVLMLQRRDRGELPPPPAAVPHSAEPASHLHRELSPRRPVGSSRGVSPAASTAGGGGGGGGAGRAASRPRAHSPGASARGPPAHAAAVSGLPGSLQLPSAAASAAAAVPRLQNGAATFTRVHTFAGSAAQESLGHSSRAPSVGASHSRKMSPGRGHSTPRTWR